MVFNIIGLIIGIMISGGSGYFLVREKGDRESEKIYGTMTAIGAVIVIFVLVKMIFF